MNYNSLLEMHFIKTINFSLYFYIFLYILYYINIILDTIFSFYIH